MEFWQIFLLMIVGMFAGWLNVMAGGGSLLTVPVMLFMVRVQYLFIQRGTVYTVLLLILVMESLFYRIQIFGFQREETFTV